MVPVAERMDALTMPSTVDTDSREPEFIFVDDVPESGNPVAKDIPPDFACEECGTPLTYAGRGRKPKYCDEHKPGRTGSATKSRGSSTGNLALIERAINELEAIYGISAQAIKFVDDRSGKIVYEDRRKLAESWRALLETNKKFRNAFAELEQKTAWLPVIMAHGDVAAAIFFSRAAERINQALSEEMMNGAQL